MRSHNGLPSIRGCTLGAAPEPILTVSPSLRTLYNDNCQAAAAMGVVRVQMGLQDT